MAAWLSFKSDSIKPVIGAKLVAVRPNAQYSNQTPASRAQRYGLFVVTEGVAAVVDSFMSH